MKIIIDMNLPPRWRDFFSDHGFASVHWSEIGPPTARDIEILEYARNRNHIVFTHDLDFSAILGRTRRIGPSIIQVRTQDVTPKAIGRLVIAALNEHREEIDADAIVSINADIFRVRILPLQS